MTRTKLSRSSEVASSRTGEFQRHTPVLLTVGFVVAMILALASAGPFIEQADVLLPAVVLTLFSLYSFFVCGRHTVTASSVVSYGVLVFIGFPGWYGALGLYYSPKTYSASSLAIVVILAFLFQAGVLLSSTQDNSWEIGYGLKEHLRSERAFFSVSSRLSVVLLLLSLVTYAAGLSSLSSSFSWLAMLAAATLAFWSNRAATMIWGVFLISVSFALATGLALGGFGRLNLAVLALSVVVVASMRVPTWTVKICAAVLTGPVLMFLVRQRLEYLEEERAGGVVHESEGVGSVVGPFHSAGTIVDAIRDGHIDPSWGQTLFNSAVIWIPRKLWPDKPVGFGREIVSVTQPWMVSSAGHSDAGTFVGEAVWNFGVWLAPIYLILFLVFVRFLDQRIALLYHRHLDTSALLLLVFVAVLSGTLLNIIWGGSSTAAARTLFPMVILGVLWFLLGRRPKPEAVSGGRQ